MIDRELGSEWAPEEIREEKTEEINEGKGLYLGLGLLSVILIIFFEFFFWYLILPRLEQSGGNLTRITGIIFIFLGASLIVNYILIALSAIFEKNFYFYEIRNKTFIYLFNSVLRELGRIWGISKDHIAHSFVKVNNALVIAKKLNIKGNKLLILLPRCLQHFNCKQMVVQDVKNCKECGKCSVLKFKNLQAQYGFHISLATGGSLARKIIMELRPSVILAVACERELVSGIQDTISIPVIGIINKRPEGPCKNTFAQIGNIEKIIEFLSKEGILLKIKSPTITTRIAV